ncbi:hypothetical protein Sinac_4285 [Singulisphaera acidiphila DSM 18658]|uniref:Uncharacterized protein n=1 Tax=Singulisphaera acidiphila (strain ATCC BAA-1392 / DSM 18658 / VKM B-2454 / MOB10) TaxID=886293 RepID=L0DGH6_SINAD|nr:hypothetical protein Sinac_4285 [Singulisphaera acidiphila DSM 18658]
MKATRCSRSREWPYRQVAELLKTGLERLEECQRRTKNRRRWRSIHRLAGDQGKLATSQLQSFQEETTNSLASNGRHEKCLGRKDWHSVAASLDGGNSFP